MVAQRHPEQRRPHGLAQRGHLLGPIERPLTGLWVSLPEQRDDHLFDESHLTIDGHAEPAVDLAVVNGVDQATFSTSSLAVGPHTITATYSGDTTFAASTTTNSLTQTVNPLALLATSSVG